MPAPSVGNWFRRSRNPPDGTGRVERTAAHRQIKSKGVPHRYCGNLMLEASPLLLTRSAHDNRFQILWPERRDFAIEDHEFFEFLEGNRLYTSVWYEDPDYREEVLVRDYNTGEVLERIPGSLRSMPDGQNWLLV